MDYDKTFEAYQKYGMGKKFEQLPDYNIYKKEQAWYEKVKSKRTGEYNQAEDLIKRELVPEGWQPPRTVKSKPVKYPLKQVSEIIRKRLVDGSEVLLSRQMWTGLDQVGNEVNISMNDKEKYDDVLPVYTLKPENPKDDPRFRDTKMVRVIDRVESRIKYTEPFTPETAQRLYDMRNGKCSLCVIDESGGPGDYPPVSVPSFEHFKMPFDELWEMVTTPKYKMDRSYGDAIEQAHIK
jgi:hypothetical protein